MGKFIVRVLYRVQVLVWYLAPNRSLFWKCGCLYVRAFIRFWPKTPTESE